MPNICRECGSPANPECTVKAEEFCMPGRPDLHFCTKCHRQAFDQADLIFDAVRSGKITIEEVSRTIARVAPN